MALFRNIPIGALAGALALQAALATTAALTTNPDYNFPGVIELILIGVAAVCLAPTFWRRQVWERGDLQVAAVLAALITVLIARYLLAMAAPASAPALGCFAMAGVAAKTECLLQLPFSTNHGLRQLLLHVTAFAVFWAAAGLARLAGGRVAGLAPVFLLTPAVFAVAAVAPKFVLGQETLAGWNLVLNNMIGTSRGSGLTANPGWLWPLLAGPGALATGLLASRSWTRVAAGATVLTVILFAVSDAGQRGGYVLLMLLAACALVYVGLWRVPTIGASWRRRTLVWLGLATAGTIAVVLGARSLDGVLDWVGQFPLFASFNGRSFVLNDPVRAIMRACAWDHVMPVIWTGFGYASWLRVAGAACADSPFIYDTAHNLWVQMIFELGAVHATIVAGAILWLIFRIVATRRERPVEIEATVLALVPAFLLVSMIQEVDYIPATYYSFASIGGLVWGASRRSPLGDATPAPVASARGRVISILLVCAGVLALAGSAGYAHAISWGGYSYAPSPVPGFTFVRWFRPEGAIAAATSASGHPYSVFPLAVPLSSPLALTSHGERTTAVTETGLTLANGDGVWPRQYRYTSNTKRKWLSRLNAFSLYLPALAADFMLLGESGTSEWEVSAQGVAEKWCVDACSVDITAPRPVADASQLWVYLEQPCTSPERPGRVSYAVDAVVQGRFVGERAGELVFTEPSAPQPIPLSSTSPAPDLWRVSLRTQHACSADVPVRGRSGGAFRGVRILFAR